MNYLWPVGRLAIGLGLGLSANGLLPPDGLLGDSMGGCAFLS